ncbi:MAG TPA: hypothetical protein VKG02_09395 [Blastocatellia bacterium]|nr:hypothetical protein [Blastocatellia bacterium]
MPPYIELSPPVGRFGARRRQQQWGVSGQHPMPEPAKRPELNNVI